MESDLDEPLAPPAPPTRRSAEIELAISAGLSCVCRTRPLGLAPSIHTGDAEFDRAFLFAGQSARAIALMDDETRVSLLELAALPGARIELVLGPKSQISFRADHLDEPEASAIEQQLSELAVRVGSTARLDVAEALERLWQSTQRASVREWIQRLLIHKFDGTPEAERAALAAIESPDPTVRVEAAGALGRSGLFHLRRIASSDDASPGLRAAAYQRMTPLMTAEEIERALLRDFARLPLEGRRAVVESAFGQLNPSLEVDFPQIFARMRVGEQLELIGLIEKVPTGSAAWFLRGLLESRLPRIRAAAVRGLASRGERSDLELIMSRTEDDRHAEVRSARAYALARLTSKRPSAGALSLVDPPGGLSMTESEGGLSVPHPLDVSPSELVESSPESVD